ncbi:MAG: DUF1501 domain-containing protein, partial [Phycisphaeraceae bacterium]
QGSLSLGFRPQPHFAPRAKRVIYIFLDGGVSHLDSFDYKPLLQRDGGKPLPKSIHTPKFTFAPQGTILRSPWQFRRYGQTGKWASNLFPHINQHMDDLCFIHSLHHENNDHFTAKNMIHTGVGREVRPTLGSWLIYGLGSENENLPGYIDILPDTPRSRPSAFLPAQFAGTPVLRPDKTKATLAWDNLTGSKAGSDAQRRELDLVQRMNRAHLSQRGEDAALEAEIANLELAFRMQTEAPDILSLQGESEATMALYGIGEPNTTDFGRALLLARRFAEKGVRYITVTHSTTKYGNLWDQHGDLFQGHGGNARAVDLPIAGLLKDLQSRGLLDDTLVMFGSEFGRTPSFEYMDGGSGRLRNGRDHNPYGFTMWFAGGGVKAGHTHGATDDYGYHAVSDKVSIHDLHATLLYIMGLDHEQLTYAYAGRHFRLTDVFGQVVRPILA